MPISSQEEYDKALSLIESGQAKDPKRLARAMRNARLTNPQWGAQKSGDVAVSDTAPEPATPPRTNVESIAGGAKFEAPPVPEKPAQEAQPDEFTPQRQLSTMDYIPGDVGGNLQLYRDLPIEQFRKQAAARQRQAIAQGQQAAVTLRIMGPRLAPEQVAQLAQAKMAGEQAMALNLDSITEESPEYRQFVDQAWEQAKQQQAAKGDQAQPMKRIKDTGWFGGGPMQFAANVTGSLPAFNHGAVDTLTLGLGKPLVNAVERLGGEGQDDLANAEEERHPWMRAAGAAVGMMSPLGLGGRMFRGGYGLLAKPGAGLLARLAGSALGGAATDLATGTGNDIVSGKTDQTMESIPGRLAQGALGGIAGQLLGTGAAKLKQAIELNAAASHGGRSVYQTLEEGGYKFDPVRGAVEPPEAKSMRVASLGPGEGGPGERVARGGRDAIVNNVEDADSALRHVISDENQQYINAAGEKLRIPLSNTVSTIAKLAKESNGSYAFDQTEGLQRELQHLDFEPNAATFDRQVRLLGDRVAAAESGGNKVLAGALKRVQAAMLQDRDAFPKLSVNGEPRSWSDLERSQSERIAGMQSDRDLTGVKGGQEAALSREADLREVTSKLRNVGAQGSDVATERALEKYAPPDIAKEIRTLKAMNISGSVGLKPGGDLPATRGGFWRGVQDVAKPRLYAVGKGLSADLPDDFPISDKLFSWLNARAPRTAAMLAGSNIVGEVQKLAEMQSRPKRVGDLTPQQKALLEGN